jgi:[acyl-carrier-protein] S-malonyltransferase
VKGRAIVSDATPTTAVMFPGQGSQSAGMRDDVERLAPELLELAEREVGADPFERLEEGTRYVQPAILCASLAGWRLACDEAPSVLTGHSLGEVAALVAAGSLSAADGLRVVALRGRLMQEAAEAAGGGGMLAVMGGGRVQVAPIAADLGLVLANDNGPRQVVLSGDRAALSAAADRARDAGLRPMELPVAGAFHSPAMADALPDFRAALAEIEVAPPRLPVFCSTTAAPFDDVRARLADGLVSPVRWRDTVEAMYAAGVRRFVEAGPGKVLVGLVRRTVEDVEVATVAAPAEVRA